MKLRDLNGNRYLILDHDTNDIRLFAVNKPAESANRETEKATRNAVAGPSQFHANLKELDRDIDHCLFRVY